MDPAAAATDTATALRSALDAAYRERQALSQRLDEVDQLITDLSQAAEGSADASTRPQRSGQSGRARGTKAATKKAAAGKSAAKKATGKKTTAKKATTKKSTAKKSAAKKASGTRSQGKATTKRAGKRTARKSTGRSTGGGQDVGRTDRVVQLIAEAASPLTTGEVRSRLLQHEPAVTSKLVSASLSYAQRKGRIRKSSDGRWIAASGATSPSSASGAPSTAGASGPSGAPTASSTTPTSG